MDNISGGKNEEEKMKDDDDGHGEDAHGHGDDDGDHDDDGRRGRRSWSWNGGGCSCTAAGGDGSIGSSTHSCARWLSLATPPELFRTEPWPSPDRAIFNLILALDLSS